MAFAPSGTADDYPGTGKALTVQTTLDTGPGPRRPALPYDELELRRFLLGGLAAK